MSNLWPRIEPLLAGVEKRAFRIACIALRDHAEAQDAVQDAMIRLVRSYGQHPEEQWRPLFYRILRNRITDSQRRRKVRNAVMAWWAAGAAEDEARRIYGTRSDLLLSPDLAARLEAGGVDREARHVSVVLKVVEHRVVHRRTVPRRRPITLVKALRVEGEDAFRCRRAHAPFAMQLDLFAAR